MAVQTSYSFATGKGIAGGIYDMYHYTVDSRTNEAATGAVTFGMGVVKGTVPGGTIALPKAASTAADFEGVVVNGFTGQHDLEGKVYLLKNQSVGVMRKGRIWAMLAEDEDPAYGDEVHLVVSGDDIGKFATTGGVKLAGRFIGKAEGGIAPVELDGVDVVPETTDPQST